MGLFYGAIIFLLALSLIRVFSKKKIKPAPDPIPEDGLELHLVKKFVAALRLPTEEEFIEEMRRVYDTKVTLKAANTFLTRPPGKKEEKT